MREFLLGRLNARTFFNGWFHLTTLAMALMLVSSGSEAQTITTSLSRSNSLAAKNHAVMPVPGWIRFCKQRPEECAFRSSEPSTITLTPQAWTTLTRVNRQVNAAIRPITDHEHWGEMDRWDLAEDGYGDCEDYQLVKRKRLVAAGFPRRALRMTAVIDQDGEPHAVMMVRTDRGDFILDNKRDAILPWRQTGYVYLQREVETGSTWVSLGGAFTSPVATAGR
ncbi:transglutaminase-like cysteine peptidase [Microvirga sp. VF16]|uniref:transglutaminase-like cysteine peptidase n=1 Tax=Microvirga sp. VF16 TaxID=2807101 RepID=UPI00193D4D17|nr:transglutaminase-like cysteine peptidase [Microvirga sp. VF16]QRM28793.1 transglutaminase-like cysteine peptidase [Microvirga sp. VF16]